MKLAIFASGTGSTAEILFKYASVVLTNNPQAGVIERAENAGIPVEIIEKGLMNLEQFGEKIIEVLGKYQFDYISQNGWEMLTPANVCQKYAGRITNNHPAPLDPGFPDFGGKGMKGLTVHQAVLNFAHKIQRPFNSEICVHLVNEELDKGLLLGYTPVEVKDTDSVGSLQERLKEAERRFNLEFWNNTEKIGKLVSIERPERLILQDEVGLLAEARAQAIAQTEKG